MDWMSNSKTGKLFLFPVTCSLYPNPYAYFRVYLQGL